MMKKLCIFMIRFNYAQYFCDNFKKWITNIVTLCKPIN